MNIEFDVKVGLFVGVLVGVDEAVAVAVAVLVLVAVGEAVAVAVGVLVRVAVGEAVAVDVEVAGGPPTAMAAPAASTIPLPQVDELQLLPNGKS
jgi:hypothetical protein